MKEITTQFKKNCSCLNTNVFEFARSHSKAEKMASAENVSLTPCYALPTIYTDIFQHIKSLLDDNLTI